MRKEYLVLLGILFLAVALRFWQLGVVPVGVTHDEIGYIYNSYSVAKTARNVNGEFLPFLTWLTGGFPFMPVPIYLSAPIFWVFELSATSARLLAATLGVVEVLLLYYLVRQLFKDSKLALLSGLFLAISPWHILLSRSAYDTNISAFFFVLGIVLFIWEITRKKIPILSSLSFLLAIFSYRGMNAVFPGIALILLWYGWQVLKMNRKQGVIFIAGVLLISATLLFVIQKYAARGYVGEVLINKTKMQEDIDNQTREANGPLFVKRFFLNKPTYMLNKWRENYLESYSPGFLFLRGERDNITSIWSRGKLYFIDALFILLGFYYLIRKSTKASIFTFALLASAGLPGMVGGPIYATRNFLLAFVFPIIAAGGIFFLTNLIPKKVKVVLIILLFITYSYLLGSFLFDYYERFAYEEAEPWFKSVKEISLLVEKERKDYKNVIVATSSIGEILQYAFYTKIDPAEVQKALRESKKTQRPGTMVIQNITFTQDCLRTDKKSLPDFEGKKPVLYIVHENCIKPATPSARIREYFGNTIWEIYKLAKS